MSKLEKLKDKAKGLEAKDPKSAIEAWLTVLQAQEQDGEPNPDLSVFNRVGDLYLKVKDPAQAADYYDRAVDKYAELGFHNKDRKSTRLNSSHSQISYAVFCLKKKKKQKKNKKNHNI